MMPISDSDEKAFEVYKNIIPDYSDFLQTVKNPLPICFWMNPLSIDSVSFENLLQQEKIKFEKIKWRPYSYKLKSDINLGTHWLYKAGLLQIQEEVSMLPVAILKPKPHDKVLDLCAAPGNKAAECGIAMKNQGLLIANDRSGQRLKALGKIIKRMSLVNTLITLYDACGYPKCGEFFDKVLVDVPCTCEGTIRKNRKHQVFPSQEKSIAQSKVQLSILKKAIQVTKPNGLICYSTCTFAPEENECMIQQILEQYPEAIQIEKIDLPNFNFSQGLLAWQQQSFNQDMKHCLRVWPQQNDSGGFFVALLRKIKSTHARKPAYRTLACESIVYDKINDYLQQRFDIPQAIIKKYEYFIASKRGIYMLNQAQTIPENLILDVAGLLCLKTKMKYPKLSTPATMLFGPHVIKNRIDLSYEQLKQFVIKKTIELNEDNIKTIVSEGYVFVFYQQQCYGMGVYYEYDNKPHLQSMFPKS